VRAVTEFVTVPIYRGHAVGQIFAGYTLCASDMTIEGLNGRIDQRQDDVEPCRVTLADNGAKTMTVRRP
jgi:hypothetical protein